MKSGEMLQRVIIALVMDAGVGHPVGVFGFTEQLVIDPSAISSASSIGVRSVFSGDGPAPETPGTVDTRVLARMPQKTGRMQGNSGFSERNPIAIKVHISFLPGLNLSMEKFHNDIIVQSVQHLLACLR